MKYKMNKFIAEYELPLSIQITINSLVDFWNDFFEATTFERSTPHVFLNCIYAAICEKHKEALDELEYSINRDELKIKIKDNDKIKLAEIELIIY